MKAVVLFSGGLDSTVILALALQKKRQCLALSFDYGQRHTEELKAAKKITKFYQVPHKIIKLDGIFGDSSLLKNEINQTPKNRTPEEIKKAGTPSTYVPARNTIFLSLALAQAEMFSADEIYLGPNALDTVYPDCSQNFIDAYQNLINVATKQSLDGKPPKLIAPLIQMNKQEIIKLGQQLEAPLELSFSCYDPTLRGTPCLHCDACSLRTAAFTSI